MATTLIMNVNPNQGYAPDQISNRLTLGELRDMIEEAIVDYGDDAEVITLDSGNVYGAKYGSISTVYGGELFEEAEE
jgi:hypothetical protein